MTHTPGPGAKPDQPLMYRIRIKGHLGNRWNDWFDDMTITLEPNGETLLAGPIVDQAALHGILMRVRDLGLPLISVMESGATQGPDGNAVSDHPMSSNKETNA